MNLNISRDWLLQMAEKEGNGIISVGGLACRLGLYPSEVVTCDQESVPISTTVEEVQRAEGWLENEMNTTKAKITVWVTEHALTEGITTLEVDDPGAETWLVADLPDGRKLVLRPYEWHRTEEAARARAKRMRAKRIADIKRELESLKAMEF